MPVTVSTAWPRAPGGDASAFAVLAFPGGGSAKPSAGPLTLSLPRTRTHPSASSTPSRGLASAPQRLQTAPVTALDSGPSSRQSLTRPWTGLYLQHHLPWGAPPHPPCTRRLPRPNPHPPPPPSGTGPLALLLGSLSAPHCLWPLVAPDPMTILQESDSHAASSTHDRPALSIFFSTP